MGKVERLPPAEVPAGLDDLLPGIDITFACNIGGDRQLQLKTLVLADTPDSVINKVLDRMADLSGRQQARVEINAVRAEQIKMKDELSQLDADIAESERKHVHDVALAEELIKECGRRIEQIEDANRQSHEARGGRGDAKLAGSAAQKVAAAEREIKSAKVNVDKLEAEKKQAIEQMIISRRRRQERLDFLGQEIERLTALIG